MAVVGLSATRCGGCGGDRCGGFDCDTLAGVDFRAEMRLWVQEISARARAANGAFLVVPQNGQELLSLDGEAGGPPAAAYVAAIDGVGREDLFYGYAGDDVATGAAETAYLQGFLDLAEANGVEALVTDYCSTPSKMDDSYVRNDARGYISFAADHRELDDLPSYPAEPFHATNDTITTLAQAQNFLYLLNASAFGSADAMVTALASTRYDLLIVDAYHDGTAPLSAAQVQALKLKAGGGGRLVIAYMSIGEAEDYRYYWQSAWRDDRPDWLGAENPDWPGNYKVEYWAPGWKALIAGDGGYLDRILAAGFDGIYLDLIDAFEHFEEISAP